MSWNSSTSRWSKRARCAAAIASLWRSSSSASSWRSSKSTADRLRLALVESGSERRQETAQRLVAARDLLDLRRGRGLLAPVDGGRVDVGKDRVHHASVAEFGMGCEDHRPEPVPVAGRRQRDRFVGTGELGEDLVEARPGQPRCLVRVEHPKPRVQPRRDGVRGEQPPAEAVDRGDRSRLPGARRRLQPRAAGDVVGIRGAARQLDANPPPHLGRGLLGEREGEDPLRLDPVVVDGLAVALDEHPGLAGAGTGLEEDVAVAIADRGRLLGRRCGAHLAGRRRRRRG